MNRCKVFTWLFTLMIPMAINALAADTPGIHLNTIPYAITITAEQGKVLQQGQDLLITAHKGTDLFNDMFSGVNKDNAPRIVFQPKGDFIFSAKFSGSFVGKYDGGALIVYGDSSSYGKLTFERGHDGQQSLWSTVTSKRADDVQHREIKADNLYVKVARAGDLYFFYSSNDGKTWIMQRSFTLDNPRNLQVGIMAQAPESDAFGLRVSDVRFAPRTFKDYWQGE